MPSADGRCKVPSKSKVELDARLNASQVHLVCVQETWLDDSIEDVSFTNYSLIARLDRSSGKIGYGGVAIFAHTSFHAVSPFLSSENSERVWCILHTNLGSIAIGNWYRAPDDSGTSVRSFPVEFNSFRSNFIGAIIVGDPNIHHKKWLVHSRENSAIGELLHKSCLDVGLRQVVRKPTRPNPASGTDYLLDLVLTDVREHLSVNVLPQIADHRVVEIVFKVTIPVPRFFVRTVWDFKHAKWHALTSVIREFDWDSLFASNTSACMFELFSKQLLHLSKQHIRQRDIVCSKREHPWLNDACLQAISRKAHVNAPDMHVASVECARVLADAFTQYQRELKIKLQSLPKSSKLWWRYNRELLNRKSKPHNVCHLKGSDGKWVYDPQEKSDLFANVFRSKSVLPSVTRMRDSVIPVLPFVCAAEGQGAAAVRMSDFCVIRTRWVLRILSDLQDCACGPDGLPSKILFECREVLAPIIAKLIRLFFFFF